VEEAGVRDVAKTSDVRTGPRPLAVLMTAVAGLASLATSAKDWERRDELSGELTMRAGDESANLGFTVVSSETAQQFECTVDAHPEGSVAVTLETSGLKELDVPDGGRYVFRRSSSDRAMDGGTRWYVGAAVHCEEAPCEQSYEITFEIERGYDTATLRWACAGVVSGLGDAPKGASVELTRR
jgi:hypothetical protein